MHVDSLKPFRIISVTFRVVINPFDPIRNMIRPTGRITRGELEVLARGLVPRPEGEGLVGYQLPTAGLGESIQAPNQSLPPGAAELLLKSAQIIPEISTLSLFLIAPTHGSPQLTVGVEFDRNITKEREQFIVSNPMAHRRSKFWRTQDPRFCSP
jgi:hypothetical protein